MTAPPHNIGIEFLSVFGLPPVDFVHLAADLGCRYIGLGLTPFRENPHNYPPWSLQDDMALRRDVTQALRARDVKLALGEGVMIRSGAEIRDSRAQIATLCGLGAERVNVVTLEPDLERCFDQLAQFAEMVAAEGAAPVLEFAPIFTIPNLQTAVEAIQHSGRSDFRLLVDTLHFVRSGARAEELARLDPNLIGYAQLCDGPAAATGEAYLHEAKLERLAPGDGEFPLAEILASLPADLVFGLEVPMHAAALAGVGPGDRLGRCVAAARRLLSERRN